MEITIDNVVFTLDTTNGISIEFNSDEANFADPRLAPNGCRKRVEFEELILKKDWTIRTKAIVSDLSPTGVILNRREFESYVSSEADTNLFRSQAEGVVNAAVLNGLGRYVLKNTRAFLTLEGDIIETQPVPIPDEESN